MSISEEYRRKARRDPTGWVWWAAGIAVVVIGAVVFWGWIFSNRPSQSLPSAGKTMFGLGESVERAYVREWLAIHEPDPDPQFVRWYGPGPVSPKKVSYATDCEVWVEYRVQTGFGWVKRGYRFAWSPGSDKPARWSLTTYPFPWPGG